MNILLFAVIILIEVALIVWAFSRASYLKRPWLWRSTLIVIVLSASAWFNHFAMGPNPLSSCNLQALGNPMVYCIFLWEEDHWTDFVMSLPMGILTAAGNHIFLAAPLFVPFILIQAIILGKRKVR